MIRTCPEGTNAWYDLGWREANKENEERELHHFETEQKLSEVKEYANELAKGNVDVLKVVAESLNRMIGEI